MSGILTGGIMIAQDYDQRNYDCAEFMTVWNYDCAEV